MTYLMLSLAVVAFAIAVLARRATRRALLSEARFRALASQWPDTATGLLDRDLRFTLFAGEAFSPHWEPEEVTGKLLAEMLPPDRFEEARPHVEAALAGERRTLEWRGVRSNLIFRVDLLPFREQNGEISHVMLAFRDITDHKVLQHSLEEQSGFLSAVLGQLGERVTVCDADGRIVHFGGRHTEGREDLHPLEWAEAFGLRHPDGEPLGPHEVPLLRALRGDKVRDVELHVETSVGTLALLASGGPVTTEDGRSLGAVVVNADLTAFRDAEGRLRRSEERHRRVVESMVDCVFETDEQGRWTHLSENWTAATGLTLEESLGRPATEFVHPHDRALHARAFAPLLAGERTDARVEHRFLTTAGAERWAEVQVRAISGWDGLPVGFVGVMRDVTDDHRARQHAGAERAVMRLLSAANSLEDVGHDLIELLGSELGWDGAELWRMGPDERLLRAADWTAAGVRLDHFMSSGAEIGYEVGEGFPGQSWMSRVPLWKSDVRGDATLRLADGVRSTVALPLRAAGAPVGVVVLVSRTPREPEPGLVRLLEGIGGHVTQFLQRREAESRAAEQAEDLTDLVAKLQSTARTDPLTGLPNRRVWDEDLERELARARRHGGSLCLAMLDLDRFKAFNDHHGHQAGDQLLAATALAWRPALRTTDTIARYGGEEFAVLLPHSDEEGALLVVERLLDRVPLGQTASAGIAAWDGTESAQELLARADAALYDAKRSGRARARFSPSAL